MELIGYCMFTDGTPFIPGPVEVSVSVFHLASGW